MKNHRPLTLSQIDTFYHSVPRDTNTAITTRKIQDPLIIMPKGRQKGSLNLERSHKTGRFPSAFEITERLEVKEADEASKKSTLAKRPRNPSISMQATPNEEDTQTTLPP